MQTVFRSIPADKLTPRSVRAVIARYLFARQLLAELDFHPQDLMERLAHAMFDGDHLPSPLATSAAEMNRVVSELTGEKYPPQPARTHHDATAKSSSQPAEISAEMEGATPS